MFESSQERQYLLREEIRDDYYRLSPRERSKISLSEYTERELAESEAGGFYLWVAIIGFFVLLAAVAISAA